ncbi:MAG: hypothetical protein HY722_00795 [Planctomycetes bacterium]|nr:hypothetical protein [Planctomycetota bacterium]
MKALKRRVLAERERLEERVRQASRLKASDRERLRRDLDRHNRDVEEVNRDAERSRLQGRTRALQADRDRLRSDVEDLLHHEGAGWAPLRRALRALVQRWQRAGYRPGRMPAGGKALDLVACAAELHRTAEANRTAGADGAPSDGEVEELSRLLARMRQQVARDEKDQARRLRELARGAAGDRTARDFLDEVQGVIEQEARRKREILG